jgi:hypothetical protein
MELDHGSVDPVAIPALAMTADDGAFHFAIANGPSRELTAIYRSGQRELSANATLQTRVRPTFRLKQKVVHNGGYAVFKGSLPEPHADGVLVLLRVKDGKGWRVIRRYRTRAGGHFVMRYHFTQTFTPTTYTGRGGGPRPGCFSLQGGAPRRRSRCP